MTATRRRWVWLFAWSLGVALVVRGGAWAMVELMNLHEIVGARRALLAGLKGELGALPALEQRAAGLHATLVTLTPRLLTGGSENAVLADLSSSLTVMARQHYGRLLRLEPIADSSPAGRFRRVRAKAILETDFEGVAGILAMLERQAEVIVPERVAITAPEPGAGVETPERLEVELELSGWFLFRADS